MDEFAQLHQETEKLSLINSKAELEQLRRKLKNRLRFCKGGIVCACALALFLTADYTAFLLTLAGSGVLAALLVNKLHKQYRESFKRIYVVRSLEEIFTELEYDPKRGISRDTIAATKMMNMGGRFCSEDYISAKYRDIAFKQSDVHIEQQRYYGKSSYYVTIFRGRWMIFNFNKEFRANLQITQKGFPNAKRKQFLGKRETLFKKVAMESETFNRRFQVFAQNEHDAFYIITPAFMERIQNLTARNKGKLMFCFVGNRLHIAIHDNKNSFEPGSAFKPIDERAVMAKLQSEIKTITQFVDELNLDNNLFKWRD